MSSRNSDSNSDKARSRRDTPPDMDRESAFGAVRGLVTLCLVTDLFGKDQDTVAADVVRARGFAKPRAQRESNPRGAAGQKPEKAPKKSPKKSRRKSTKLTPEQAQERLQLKLLV